MKLSTFVQSAAVISAATAAAAFPFKRSTLCSNVTEYSTVTLLSTQDRTVTETTTVTETAVAPGQPNSVTIALQGPEAITSSLSSAFSVESEQLEIASQIAPINPLTSGQPPTTTSATVFTRTIAVPVVEATNNVTISGQSSRADVYFISETNGTTSWLSNFTPAESMTIGTTTVTLSPIPSSQLTSSATRTNTVTSTISQTQFASSPVPVEKSGRGCVGRPSSDHPVGEADIALECSALGQEPDPASVTEMAALGQSVAADETTVFEPAPTSIALPTDADGNPVNITFPIAANDVDKRSEDAFRARAVCEWVTVTLWWGPASWRNNWDGSTTVDCARVSPATSDSEPATSAPTTVVSEAAPTQDRQPTSESGPDSARAESNASAGMGSAPSDEPASCGLSGDFTLDFDTLPVFSPPDNDTAPFPPIFNPYRHLFFSSGWAYVPPPTVPVSPQEGNHLAIYVPTAPETNNSLSQSTSAGVVAEGAFGSGPRASVEAYWFDVQTLAVFCDHGEEGASQLCDFTVTGYKWEESNSAERTAVVQHFPLEPCPTYPDCQTVDILLSDEFRNLSSLGLQGVVEGEAKRVFMDTVQLSWSNNTCDAGLLRASNA